MGLKSIRMNTCRFYKKIFKTALSKESFNSVSWVHTSRRSFGEYFCLVFMGRDFLFHHRHESVRNVHLQILEKECCKASLSKGKFNSVSWMQTSQRSFWECFCLVFMWRYFLFHHSPQIAPNINLQILQKDCFKSALSEERFSYVSWMHKSQRTFWDHFCYILCEDISVSTIGFIALQMNTCRFYKKTVSNLLHEK